jgi:hypothetical protein
MKAVIAFQPSPQKRLMRVASTVDLYRPISLFAEGLSNAIRMRNSIAVDQGDIQPVWMS